MNNQDLVPLPHINEKGKVVERFIPFALIDFVLIGMYVEKISIPHGIKLHRYNAILVIRSNGEYLFKKIITRTDLHEWTSRFKERISAVRYTDKDLSKACRACKFIDVDFMAIHGVEEDIVSPMLGRERNKSTLDVWVPEGMLEELEHSYKMRTIPRTRKAEVFTVWILFLYNFLFILLVFPTTPVDSVGVIQLTNTILVGYILANLLIPVAIVLWRDFTHPTLPLLFTVVTLTSNSIALYLAVWKYDFAVSFSSIILLNVFNLVLWTVMVNSMKWCKGIVEVVRGWEMR